MRASLSLGSEFYSNNLHPYLMNFAIKIAYTWTWTHREHTPSNFFFSTFNISIQPSHHLTLCRPSLTTVNAASYIVPCRVCGQWVPRGLIVSWFRVEPRSQCTKILFWLKPYKNHVDVGHIGGLGTTLFIYNNRIEVPYLYSFVNLSLGDLKNLLKSVAPTLFFFSLSV